ncbi:putative transposase [Entomortierella parvispora]|uniref:Transposase n=1 Tax=Entomortierella parvispora TaxID=205924 RepID=A0A9P3H0A0_9FUNG|nr:putative transposase [Entomortierella parvispora]
MKPIPPSKFNDIKQQVLQGKPLREVARAFNVSPGSVATIRKTIQENVPPPCIGRPKKISDQTRKLIARELNNGILLTMKDAVREIRILDGRQVHRTTVQRNLKDFGVKAWVKPKKPKLEPHQRQARYAFARRHEKWTIDQWKNVMFSDESSISRIGSFGRQYFYSDREHKRSEPHQVKETKQSGGGKIMVWGCMIYYGLGDLSWIPGKINSDQYLTVLKDYVLRSRDWFGMDRETFIFQQDNASIHTARIIKDYFSEQQLTVLEWPANSPDLNPIENLWAIIKRQLDEFKVRPKNFDELWENVQQIWEKISLEDIQNLYDSLPNRIQQVQKRKGGHSDY